MEIDNGIFRHKGQHCMPEILFPRNPDLAMRLLVASSIFVLAQ